MAAASTEPHTIVQSWVSVELAEALKASARADGTSLSSLIRDALEASTSPMGEGSARGGPSLFTRHGADAEEQE